MPAAARTCVSGANFSQVDESSVKIPLRLDAPVARDRGKIITAVREAAKLDEAHPWDGAAFYLKITKLAEPAGALFVEEHVVFAEPTGWFDGANLLRSKLPLVIQNNVRTMRREWAKGPGK